MLATDRRRPVPLRPDRSLRHDVRQRQRIVGPEPLRALPAGTLGELGSVVEEALVPRGRAHSPRVRQHLTGVDDVVDLVVLRATARLDVQRALLEVVQPVGVHRPQVELAAARRQEVDDRLRGAAAVRDPDAVGQPETADLRRRPRERVVVDREREVPVERLGDANAGERRQQLVRPAQRLGPELLRERPCRDLVSRRMPLELVRLDRDRVVAVGADAVAVAPLAEVHGTVLMAQDRMLDLHGRAGQLRQRLGPGEEMLHRLHRDHGQAERAHELGRPEAERDERRGRDDRALVGLDAAHAPAGHVDAGHARAADERRAARLGALLQRLADVAALRDAVARDIQGTEHQLAVEQRVVAQRLVRADDMALETPRRGERVPSPDLVEPLRRGGDLERADLPPGSALGRVELAIERPRPLRERAGELRAVGLEAQAGGVERRASRVADRALVDHDDVAQPRLREVVRGRAADDAGADHDDVRALLHAAGAVQMRTSSRSSPPSPTTRSLSGRPSSEAACSAALRRAGVGRCASHTQRR